MADDTSDCPKCGAKMEQGFLLDYINGNVRSAQSVWVEGPVAPSIWSGVKLGGRRQISISGLRCTSCGFLEFYAK
jgi:DNA-directed RNA polymerase subunit RPC12/RpoP